MSDRYIRLPADEESDLDSLATLLRDQREYRDALYARLAAERREANAPRR